MRVLLVHNWPGQKNSELELIKRIIRVLSAMGHEFGVIDPLGHPLDNLGGHIEDARVVNFREYDFCLSLHYVNPNLFDTFSYAVNWNPLNYVVRNPLTGEDLPVTEIAFRTACLESHHVLLGAGSEEMDDFAGGLNALTSHHLVKSSPQLHTTSDIPPGLRFPDFSRFRVFYIGANWERQVGISRHGSLMERLDQTGLVDFYGVREQHGVFLWEGINNYKGELPFDGATSILQKSNECGVSLVLHSNAHRSSGLASTRVFQACAAKTLTICDGNPFVDRAFGDSVLPFEVTGDAARDVESILEKISWIRENPALALQKAKAAHEIFRQRFSLEKQMAVLCDGHEARVKAYLDQFGAKHPDAKVDVIYVHDGSSERQLGAFFEDLSAQQGVRPRAVTYAPARCLSSVKTEAERLGVDLEVAELPEEAIPLDGWITAHALRNHITAPYFGFYSLNTRWHKWHLTQLVRKLEDTDVSIAHSGTYLRSASTETKGIDYYLTLRTKIDYHPKPITPADLGGANAHRFTASSMLFRTKALKESSISPCLRFFDKGWAIFVATYFFVRNKELPVLMPKLTDVFLGNGLSGGICPFMDGRQTAAFEKTLVYAFFKYSPQYQSAVLQDLSANAFMGRSNQGGSSSYSINEYMEDKLQYRPGLLRVYRSLFRAASGLLRLPQAGFKEGLTGKSTVKREQGSDASNQ